MDPLACLLAADRAIADLELDDAAEHLDNYAEWRRKGGFEPILTETAMRGDDFHAWCAQRLIDCRSTDQRNTAEIDKYHRSH